VCALTRIVCLIALSIHQAERQRTTPHANPQSNNAMRLFSRRRRPEALHAFDFLSTAARCGASCISRSAGKCANNREREKEREPRVYSDFDALSTLTRTRKPSAAARPSAAEKRGSGVFPDNVTPHHAHAHNKPSAVEERHSSDCNATQHATKRGRERLQTV
jgi:hypothetical protein